MTNKTNSTFDDVNIEIREEIFDSLKEFTDLKSLLNDTGSIETEIELHRTHSTQKYTITTGEIAFQ